MSSQHGQDAQQKRNIVIVGMSSLAPLDQSPADNISSGGGVIGSAVAYYLVHHPKFNSALHTITLLEATSIAAGASGKSGGLLALWAYPQCLVPLSYRLHAELAAEHGGFERWGYRLLKCGSIAAVAKKACLNSMSRSPAGCNATTGHDGEEATRNTRSDDHGTGEERLCERGIGSSSPPAHSPLPKDLDWIDPETVRQYEEMGQPGFTDTAQVHPLHFTSALAGLAQAAGVDVRTSAKVTNIVPSQAWPGLHTVQYVDRTRDDRLEAIDAVNDVIVTAGPWTGKLLPRSKIEGLRAHSVVFKADVSPFAVFTDIQLPGDYIPEHRARMGQKRKHRGHVDPEVYARPFGEVYACGEPDKTVPLPETADQAQTDEAQCDDLSAYLATVSRTLARAPIKAKQACYIPQHIRFGTERGPLIGPTSQKGLWIAAGHTCWGIQNGPGTGLLMAEWIFDGKPTAADIDVLHPAKFKV